MKHTKAPATVTVEDKTKYFPIKIISSSTCYRQQISRLQFNKIGNIYSDVQALPCIILICLDSNFKALVYQKGLGLDAVPF